MHKFTQEEIEFLVPRVVGSSYKELTELLNEHFEQDLKQTQIRSFIKNRKLNTGRTGKFEKGHVPANKGTKGIYCGGKETQFKKGEKPHNYMPKGSERVKSDGYVYIKVAEPSKWRQKHLMVWEEHRGKIPARHRVIFGDGNKLNCCIDNLILVSMATLLELNKQGLIKGDTNLTKTGVIIAELHRKIYAKKKERSTSNVRD
jgi:hypothetical protein